MTLDDFSKEQLASIIETYVGIDLDGSSPEYVRDMLDSCGVGKKEAEVLGLGYIFDED